MRSLRDRKVIIFVRHGESTKNVGRIYSSELGKYPLTRRGREQVGAVADALSKLTSVDRLYAGPVLRAQETAEIISRRIGIRPVTNSLLWERSAGKYEGKKYKRGGPDKVLADQIRRGYPDWESWQSVIKRMRRFSKVARAGRIIIAVTHGDPIKAVLGYLLNKKESELPGLDKLGILMATMTIVDFGKKGKNAIVAVGVTKLPIEFRR